MRQLLSQLKIAPLPKRHLMLWDSMAYAFLFYVALYWLGGLLVDTSLFWLAARTLLVLTFVPIYFFALHCHQVDKLNPCAWAFVVLGLIAHYDYWGGVVFILVALVFISGQQSGKKVAICSISLALLTIAHGYYIGLPNIYLWVILPILVASSLVEHSFFNKIHAQRQLNLSQAQLAAKSAELERERIARDMHDVLGHTLSAIVVKAELAGKLINHDNEKAISELHDIEHTARQVLQQVRQAVSGYQANGLQHEYNMARTTLAGANILVSSHADPVLLSNDNEVAACMIMREAITNILRHANASKVSLEGKLADGYYHLSITDNGQGFDAKPLKNSGLYKLEINDSDSSTSQGIKNMYARASTIQAKLRITSDANGSKVHLRVPHCD